MNDAISTLIHALAWMLLGGLGLALTTHNQSTADTYVRWLGALP